MVSVVAGAEAEGVMIVAGVDGVAMGDLLACCPCCSRWFGKLLRLTVWRPLGYADCPDAAYAYVSPLPVLDSVVRSVCWCCAFHAT